MECVDAQGERFAVASGSPQATRAAADILLAGGNVVDAALAGSAALCVTLPHAVSIGGDLFAVLSQQGRTPIAVNGAGAAPARASIDRYLSLGCGAVPRLGPLSIQTPGLVAGWEALCAGHTSLPLAQLLEPAVALARDGFAVGRRLATLAASAAPEYAEEPGWAAAYLPNGMPPRQGDVLRQPRLADTLTSIADQGPRSFYEGPIAQDIARTIMAAGGVLAPEDFAATRAVTSAALDGSFAGRSIWTQPPVSQGVVLLRALGILEARGWAPLAEMWPRAVDAFAQAFSERLALLGDAPDARRVAEAIRDGRAADIPYRSFAAQPGPDTTTICVIDHKGNAASLILSIFADFGSGVVSAETGILMNNRLSAFFMDPKHPNGLAPGKRSMQTLHSVLVDEDGEIVMAGGSPGGDNQPQVNAQILSRVLVHGESMISALAAPRWALFPGTSPLDLMASTGSVVQCEPGLPDDQRAGLGRTGRLLSDMAVPDIGSAKWVVRTRSGASVSAFADRRRDAAVWAL